ncbi:MAG: tetratricopeptide repeat protein [Verrucomicrobiaceae bacterium]|nr:tetratricopeptide repeat protein [Verrucomicrobiaceae bacterium]
MSKSTLHPGHAPTHETPEPSGLEAVLEKNIKTILLVCGLAVAALAVYAVISYRNHQVAEAAAGKFAAAQTVEDCDAVTAEFAGTPAAGNALLLKAKLLWEQNKKDTSVAVLKEFMTKHADHDLAPAALLSLGSRQEAMGEKADAEASFKRLASEFKSSELAALAQIRLADILWAEGKEEEARKLYDALPSQFTGSQFFDESTTRLEWLSAKLPTKETEAPKPPPGATPPPAAAGAPGKPLGPMINLTPGQTSTTVPVTIPAPAPAKPAATTPPPAPKPAAPTTPAAATPPVPKPTAPTTPAAATPSTPKPPTPAAPAAAVPSTPKPVAPAPASGAAK